MSGTLNTESSRNYSSSSESCAALMSAVIVFDRMLMMFF